MKQAVRSGKVDPKTLRSMIDGEGPGWRRALHEKLRAMERLADAS